MKINNKLIRKLSQCYDPIRVVKDENESLEPIEWVEKYRGKLPDKDIIWLLCHNEFLSDKSLRLFAVWCAREALKLVKNPEPLSIEACNVAELFANGEATNEELYAARSAARSVATAAKFNAVMATARDTACNAAMPAAKDAARCAAMEACWAAAWAVLWDATGWDVARAAAAKAAARAVQLDKLLTYLQEEQQMTPSEKDFKNKLIPFRNLITMIENGLLIGTVEANRFIHDEIKICKESLRYLTNLQEDPYKYEQKEMRVTDEDQKVNKRINRLNDEGFRLITNDWWVKGKIGIIKKLLYSFTDKEFEQVINNANQQETKQ